MMIQEEFTFDLSSDLEYQDPNSGNATTSELILKAPISKHEKFVCQLEQMLTKAAVCAQQLVKSTNNDEDIKDKNKVNAEEASIEDQSEFILMALRMSDIDFYEYKKIIYQMITNDLCFIRGTQKDIRITQTLLNDINLKDKTRLVGEYSANFISP